jgi:hypothetical protein
MGWGYKQVSEDHVWIEYHPFGGIRVYPASEFESTEGEIVYPAIDGVYGTLHTLETAKADLLLSGVDLGVLDRAVACAREVNAARRNQACPCKADTEAT